MATMTRNQRELEVFVDSVQDQDAAQVEVSENCTPENSSNSSGDRRHNQDGSWAILVCVSSMLTQGASFGPILNFGVLYPALLEHYKEDKATTAFVYSMYSLGLYSFSLVTGTLCLKYPCRNVNLAGQGLMSAGFLISSFAPAVGMLYATHLLLVGPGTSFMMVSSFSIVAKYFTKYRNFASSLAPVGSMIGVLIMAPVTSALLDSMGIFNTYRIYAVIVLVPVLFNSWIYDEKVELAYTPTAEELREKEEKMKFKKLLDFSVLKNKRLLFFAISISIYHWALFVPIVHMARHSLDHGISEDRSSNFYMGYSAGSMCARIIVGRLGDLKWINKLHIIQGCTTMMGFITFALPSLTTLPWLISYMSLLGAFEGGILSLFSITLYEIAGPHKHSQAIGMLYFFSTPFVTSGPPLAGLITDLTGSYDLAFYLAATVFLTSGMFSVVALNCCLKTSTSRMSVEQPQRTT